MLPYSLGLTGCNVYAKPVAVQELGCIALKSPTGWCRAKVPPREDGGCAAWEQHECMG